MNIKNTPSLLLGALLACLAGCASPDSPDHVVDAVFPSPLPFGPPGAPLIIGPFTENLHNLIAHYVDPEMSYEAGLRADLAKPGQDKPSRTWDHWNAESITPRVGRFLLNYDSDRDGPSIWNKWGKDRENIMETFNRMVFHKNSDNPFQN